MVARLDRGIAEVAKNIGKGDSRIVKVRDTLAAGVSAYSLITNLYNGLKNKADELHFGVYLEDDDDLFDHVQEWLITLVPQRRQRQLRAYTHQRSEIDDDFESPRKAWRVYIENVSSRPFNIVLDGHDIQVSYQEPEATASANSHSGTIQYTGRAKLHFIAKSAGGRDAVIKKLSEIAATFTKENENVAAVYRATSWGQWQRFYGPPRKMETVILDGDLKADIVDDLRRFLRHEQKYADLGLPWHRGYMLHGPPGTGKTSLARGLASELNLDLYYVPLSDLKKDGDLTELLGRVRPRSILLLEDIDVVRAATKRSDEGEGITLTGLLNALDGAVTPHGMVTVMTTNRLKKIDSALIRPGRADRVIELGYLTDDQLRKLVNVMAGNHTVHFPSIEDSKLTAAEILEVAKYRLDEHPSVIVKAVWELVNERCS